MRKRSEAGQQQPKQQVAPEVVKIPHDPMNEQVVIAACLIDLEVRKKLVNVITAEHFFGKEHGKIWGVIRELESKGLAYDPATVHQLDATIATTYLDQLIAQRPRVPPNLAYHVEMLEWDRVRIESAKGSVSAFLEGLRDVKTDPETLRSLARSIGSSFSGKLNYLRDPGHLVESIRTARKRRREGHACYPFGFPDFDVYADNEGEAAELRGTYRVTPGAAPKEVSMITGVSGSGKSTIVTSFVNAQAVTYRRKVLYGAWEMGSEVSLELCACFELGFSRQRVLVGDLTDEEDRQLDEKCEELSEFIRFFEIPFGRKQGEKQLNDRNLDLIHGYISASGCEVFVADLLKRALRQSDPDEEEAALYRMQAISQETNVHTMIVHQQRLKDLEQRTDKRPTRDAVKGSSAWVEIPSTIMGVHMPALWKNVLNDKMEIILLKQRFGKWPLSVEFDYEPEYGRITNGRSIEYTRPGEETAIDAFLSEDRKEKKGGKHGGRKRI